MPSCSIQLVAGLANPGKTYAKTRHNAGAWVVEAFAKKAALSLKATPKFQGYVAKLDLKDLGDNKPCWLLIPSTYMNHSGHAVRSLAQFYRIPPEAILVVHDDLDLPPGIARFKHGGGEGGHNGLKDIATQLGDKNFWRLRMGIGHPGQRDQVLGYVLSPPSPDERQHIDKTIAFIVTLLIPFIKGEQQNAIQQLHNFKEQLIEKEK
jgi:peptidyl-tRNA hydrolase, PTH1 family